MKPESIAAKNLYYAWTLAGVSAIFLAIGLAFIKWWMLLGAVLINIVFLLYSHKKLRCPKCGHSESLLRLTLALSRPRFCYYCGQKIQISKGKYYR